MRSYSKFLHLFIYYMCSRCEVAADGHDRQPDDGSGRHAHNGEMLDRLEPHAPTVDRIFSAYIGYRSVGDGPSTLRAIANGYNNPADPNTIPRRLKLWNEVHLYTALSNIYNNTNSVWLRHGVEHPQHADYTANAKFPPDLSRYNVGELTREAEEYRQGYFAVDLDTLPFRGCSVHHVDVECGMPWAFVAGYIPLEQFQKFNGTLHNPPDRDHYYARATVPAQHWTYIYTDIPRRAIHYKQQVRALQNLQDSDLSHIHHSTLQQHHRLTNLLNIHSITRPHVVPYKAAKR